MIKYTENVYEKDIIKKFEEIGYTHLKGKDLFRESSAEVLNIDILQKSLYLINAHIPPRSIDEVVQKLRNLVPHPSSNRDFLSWVRAGIPISYQDRSGETINDFVNLFDWQNISNNIFHIVDQLSIRGPQEIRRPDLIIYINGLPLFVFELKSPSKKDLNLHIEAFNQLKDYKHHIPRLFIYNAILAINDGLSTRVGSSTADLSRFMPWSSIDGMEQIPSRIETVIEGMCQPERLLDLIRDFIFYTKDKKPIKIVASWHQYFSVKKALPATDIAINGDKKIGVLWHTQGSGKSFTMVMYANQLTKYLNNPTILVLTDRNDLDNQLYKTFSETISYLNNSIEQASSSNDLKEKLHRQSGGIIFSTVQKFTGDDRGLMDCLSERDDIIVIVDEAHRSHYGMDIKAQADLEKKTIEYGYSFSKQVRTALPNASFIGFTGTPIEEKDKSTRDIFGNNIHVYGLTQSVKDGMTTKITYHNRIARLRLNDPILAAIDNIYTEAEEAGASIETISKSQKELAKSNILYESGQRLDIITKDIVQHFDTRPQSELKGMIVCSSRQAASAIYDVILKEKPNWHDNVKVMMTVLESDAAELQRFKYSKTQKSELDRQFKDPEDPFNLVIVVDMWLTGFDVPCLGVMYIDKELDKHNLMQTIARVNRIYPDKEYGLIYDYRGIFSNLQEALKMYAYEDTLTADIQTKENFITNEDLLGQFHTCLEKIGDFFYGIIEIKDLLLSNVSADSFYKALDFLEGLYLQNDERFFYFRKLSFQLNATYKMCHQLISDENGKVTSLIVTLNTAVSKSMNLGFFSTVSLNNTIKKLLPQVVFSNEVDNVLTLLDSEGVNILDPEILEKISKLPHKNISIKMLDNIITDKITQIKKTNLVLSEKYSEKLYSILQKYENKSITSNEILNELIQIAKEISNETNIAKTLKLTDEEYAFYCAIADKKHSEFLTTEILCDIAHELVKIVQSSKTIDWHKKGSARAKMRLAIKRLLKDHKYPPDEENDATEMIIKQAEEQEA